MRRSLALSMTGETHSTLSYFQAVDVRSRGLLRRFIGLILGVATIGHVASAAELTLAWNDNSNNEDGFRIERSLDGSSFTEIATVGANVATYQDTTIAEGQNYTYRVRAFNEFGDSGYSNSASGSVEPSGSNEADTMAIGFSGLRGGVYEPGQADAFQVVVSGAESAIQSVQYFYNDNFVATENSSPYEFTFSSLSEGMHALKAVVTTDFGVYEETVFVTVETPVNLAPSISKFADLSLSEGITSALVEFTIGDADTTLSELVVSAISSNTALIGESGIVLSGSGPNRSIGLTATEGRSGTATITISISDGTNTVIETFELEVREVAAPTISPLDDIFTSIGEAITPVTFSVQDNETPASDLSITVESSNTLLLPNENIAVGGSGENRNLFIIPAAGELGVTTVTVTVSDGVTDTVETLDVVNRPQSNIFICKIK